MASTKELQDAAIATAINQAANRYAPERVSQRQALKDALVSLILGYTNRLGGMAWDDLCACLHETEAALKELPMTFAPRTGVPPVV